MWGGCSLHRLASRLLVFYCVCCMGAHAAHNRGPVSKPGTLRMHMAITSMRDEISTLGNTTRRKIGAFLAAEVQHVCGPACVVTEQDVLIAVSSGSPPAFELAVEITHLRNANVLGVKQADAFASLASVQRLAARYHADFAVTAFALQGTTSLVRLARASVCGDSIVQAGEVCDDGNKIEQDGCSSSCTLESGYMCYSSRRGADSSVAGTMVEWGPHEQRVLSVLETPETCTSANICRYEHPWQPDLWLNVYGNSSGAPMLPAAGYYCGTFCAATFEPPAGYEFKKSCQPTTIDECIRGLTTCDANAYCLEPPDGIGYSCRCDADFFASALAGTACEQSGVEVVVNMTGGFAGDAVDRIIIQQAREKIITALFDLGYIKKDKSNTQLVLEGVIDYPLEIIETNLAPPPFAGRSLWRIILRIPSGHTEMSLFAKGTFLQDYTAMAAIFPASANYLLHSVQRCSNDGKRMCLAASDCLSGGSCLRQPDTSVRILSAGGSTAPLSVSASGSNIVSVEYDIKYSAFKIRMRYDPNVVNTVDVLYLSHMASIPTTAQLASFDADTFPCLPIGLAATQQDRQNTVCCLAPFAGLYTTVATFGAFVNDPGQAVRAAIDHQGSCNEIDAPPTNTSADLLRGVPDFVVGALARMPRSHATIDPTPTRGYRDINLFLALEDVERSVAVKTLLPTGKNLRFFVGMAHIKPTRTNRFSATASQVDISTDITDSYVYTTPVTSTDLVLKSFAVKMSVVLPVTLQDFDANMQAKFKNAVDAAVSAQSVVVTIDNIDSVPPTNDGQRRLLAGSVRIDVTIKAPDNFAADAMVLMLTLWNLNAKLTEVGLPEGTIVDGPRTVGGSVGGGGASARVLLDVVVRLTEVLHENAQNTSKMATIVVIVSEGVTAGDVHQIIPVNSVRIGLGYTYATSSAMIYPCMDLYGGSFKETFDTVMEDQQWCATQHDICAAQGPAAIAPGGLMEFTFALPDSVWDQARFDTEATSFLATFLFIDFNVVVFNTLGKQVTLSLKTQTPIRASNILRQCVEKKVASSIEDMMEIDMFLGLAGNESSFEASLVQSLDITKQSATNTASPLVLQRDISSKASNVMTMLFKGDPEIFDTERTKQFTLAVEDIISLHFLNDEKRVLVEKLIADGLAFTLRNTLHNNPSSLTAMEMLPTPALLAYCPLQTTRGMFGCNARREIRQRTLEFKTNSITSITGHSDEDVQVAYERAGVWSELLLGGSEYARQLGYNHSRIMHEKNNLNARYRKGFMISPTIPWRQAEIDQATQRTDSIFDLAQHMITTVMVSLDTNFGQLYEADVELRLPYVLPITQQQVIEHQLLISTAFAQAASLESHNVYIDLDTIVQTLSVLGRRRTLLQLTETTTNTSLTHTNSEFDIVAGFAIAKEEDAIQQAVQFADSAQNPDSLLARMILQNINRALARVIDYYGMPTTIRNTRKRVLQPQLRSICYDDTKWEIEVAHRLGIDLGLDNNGRKRHAFVGCQSRRVGSAKSANEVYLAAVALRSASVLQNNSMSIRGPMLETDWDILAREDVLNSSRAFLAGWQWWDFCAPPPRIATHSADFLSAWATVKEEASLHCCPCKLTPTIDKTSGRYQHKYTWPLRLENHTIYDRYTQTTYPLHSADAAINANTFKINPQIRNFRLQYGANTALSELDNSTVLPPPPWDVNAEGYALFPNCDAGYWLASKFGCEMCHINTFRRSDVQQHPGDGQAHLRGGVCTHCPPNTVAGFLSSTVEDCLCIKGYQSNATQVCEMCPPNTYKDTNSNLQACIPCGTDLESRSGSINSANCVLRISVGELEAAVHIYSTVLGLLYYSTPVEPAWKMPRAIDQDQTMLCVLYAGPGAQPGVSLDCGSAGGVFHDLYAQNPVIFGQEPNVLHSTAMDANSNQGILTFHGPAASTSRLHIVTTPALGVDFLVANVDRTDYKQRVKHISLYPRPAYMGPSPPGFVEQIVHNAVWVRGIVFSMTLRMHIAHNDLSRVNAGNDVYMVNFVSTHQLDPSVSSIDWQWIVCGRKVAAGGSAYDLCRHEPDPDNPTEQNFANPHVLDGRITRLNGEKCCQSCFDEYDWMPDCSLQHRNPRRNNLYDNTMEWVPFLHRQPPQNSGTFYLYTFFTNGESAACIDNNCNEAAVYRNMPLHLTTERTAAWDNALDFLPGTHFTYRAPFVQYTSLPLYTNMLSFLSMNKHPENIQDTMVAPRLDQLYIGHSCHPTNASSLECTRDDHRLSSAVSTTTRSDNMYQADIADFIETTPIMPYVYSDAYAETVAINYCCEVPDLDLTCTLELHEKTCNKDDVVVQNGTTVHLQSARYMDITACVSTGSSPCLPKLVQGLPAMRARGPSELGPATQVYLDGTRGSNRMRMSADFTADWRPMRMPASQRVRELLLETVGAAGSGMIHYKPVVAHYFAGLPLCTESAGWDAFDLVRTLAYLEAIGPCKTRQAERNNFVYYHTVEIGVHFAEATVFAFFKTFRGHNCVADMRTAYNMRAVSMTTNTSTFDNFALTEARLAVGNTLSKVVTDMTAQTVFVGDFFVYTPSHQHIFLNVTILAPHPLLGHTAHQHAVQGAGTQFLLQFPGIYTIIEDGVFVRRGGQALPSTIKRYVRVRKRDVSQNSTASVRVPLQYMALVGTIAATLPARIGVALTAVTVPITRVFARVVDGATNDVLFALHHQVTNIQPCRGSRGWDKYDANVSRSNANMDKLLPCYIEQHINGTLQNVSYMRDMVTRETYATYTDWARTE